MQSHKTVERALALDKFRSNSFRLSCEYGDTDSDSDNDNGHSMKPRAFINRRWSLQDVGKKVIKSNTKMGGVSTKMVLETAVRNLDRPRDKENNDFISEVLRNAAVMAKTGSALREIHDPLFAEDSDRMEVFNVITRELHQTKINVVRACWDHGIIKYKGEAEANKIKYESMRRTFQDSRESYLKEVAALRDQIRMRGDIDDELPSMDIVSYFDPEHVMLPEEQRFLFDAVKEKVKMMIERNPTVEKCIDFGQLERLQSRVESNELQETKAALKRALTRLKDAEAVAAGSKTFAKPENKASLAGASEKMLEQLESQNQDLRNKLSSETHALKEAKGRILGLEGERDDLSQSLRDMTTELMMHKTELNRLQESLLHYESLAGNAEKQQAHLESVIEAQEIEIKQRKKFTSHHSHRSQSEEGNSKSVEEIDDPVISTEKIEDSVTIMQLQQMQEERDASLARCRDLVRECDQMRQMMRRQIEHFLEMKSQAILDGADSIMEQAEILGCANTEGSSEGVRICECGNVLMDDAIYCRKCGTKWQKPMQMVGELVANEESLVSLTVQLKDADEKLDAAKVELRLVLESQAKQEGDVSDAGWLNNLIKVQNEVDAQQREKKRLEAMLLQTRLRVANQASSGMSNWDGTCTCNCAEELRALQKVFERMQHLCAESTASLQHAALENSVVHNTLNKMRDTLGKAADAAQKVATDNPEVRLCLKAINDARAQSVFNRLHYNYDESYRKQRREARRTRMLEDTFKAVYAMDPSFIIDDIDNLKTTDAAFSPLRKVQSQQEPLCITSLLPKVQPPQQGNPAAYIRKLPSPARECGSISLPPSRAGGSRRPLRILPPESPKPSLPPLNVKTLSLRRQST